MIIDWQGDVFMFAGLGAPVMAWSYDIGLPITAWLEFTAGDRNLDYSAFLR